MRQTEGYYAWLELRQYHTEKSARYHQVWYNKTIDKQMTISAFSDELAQVRTKKKEFLSQIERIIPWKEWLALIQPYYYKGECGNKPYPWRPCCGCICCKTSMIWVTRLLWQKPSTAAHFRSSATLIPATRFRTGIPLTGSGTCSSRTDCKKSCSLRW